jgi:squalene cyclase
VPAVKRMLPCMVGTRRTAGEAVRRACEFLVSKQRTDGGWSEDFQVNHWMHFSPVREDVM